MIQQLTEEGMREHYLIGRKLREKYIEKFGSDFLSSEKLMDQLYVQSTYYNRTLLSASFQLLGLLGPQSSELPEVYPDSEHFLKGPFSPELQKRIADQLPVRTPFYLSEVPIYRSPKDHEYLLNSQSECGPTNTWEKENIQNPGFFEVWRTFNSTLTEMEENLNITLTSEDSYSELSAFTDAMIADIYEGVPIPGGYQKDTQIVSNMTFLYNWWEVNKVTANPMQRTTYPIPIFQYVLDVIKKVKNGESPLKLVLLSGHDGTLNYFWSSLGLINRECIFENYMAVLAGKQQPHPNCVYPNYASNIIIEFYNTENPYVILYYNGNPIKIIGNYAETSYDKFEEFLLKSIKNQTLEDYYQICRIDEKKYSDLLFNGILFTLVFLGAMLAYFWIRGEKIESQDQKTPVKSKKKDQIESSLDSKVKTSDDVRKRPTVHPKKE